jgi:hypothetical protein
MHLVRNLKQPVTRNLAILLAAITLSTALATDVLAAGHVSPGVAHRSAHARGRFVGGPLLDRVPRSPPTFNPTYRYTVPQAPETPVSPASPGSVFSR